MQFYQYFLRPLLFNMDPEHAHEMAVLVAKYNSLFAPGRLLTEKMYNWQSPNLHQEVMGIPFRNPVGLAAGFDKNAYLPQIIQALGFGYIEIGSITAQPAEGNPQPRLFRLPEDQSLINRMGLNNEGAETITNRIARIKPSLDIPIGVNIAKTNDMAIHGDAAVRDYVTSFRLAVPVADYITINVSCPNTGEGKTFEDPKALEVLLASIRNTMQDIGEDQIPPVFVKLSVDLDDDQIRALADVVLRYEMDGFVATNTSNNRSELNTDPEELAQIGNGGLSGKAIHDRSVHVIHTLYDHIDGSKPIIGVGGIDSPEAALETLQAGASLLQIYSALVFEGPSLVKRINQYLAQQIKEDGYTTYSEWLQSLR